jgi:predicted metal-dependent phosphoesterase TrpH
MTVYDLHCHSSASDGTLTPGALVERAVGCQVGVLALTDHDTLQGYAEARAAAQAHGLDLVSGVEISVTWNKSTVHVVGLRLDPDNAVLQAGLLANRTGRDERARRMGEALARLGIAGAYEGARERAGNKELISRTHFGRFLVDQGVCTNMKSVFKRFLVKGKPGYVEHQWASLSQSIEWIRAAGGQAVLAHPGRYTMGREKLRLLIDDFKTLGGVALEVVSGSHTAEQTPQMAALAIEYGLLASAGSDFHSPGEGGRELGRMQAMPADCTPIWQDWQGKAQ